MRNYLVYLLLIMFVGGHVLSNNYHQYNNGIIGSNIATQGGIDGSGKAVSTAEIAQVIKVNGNDNNPQNDIPLFNAAKHLHCVADCGLVTSLFTAYHPSPRLGLVSPNDPTATINSISDLFRPPIV